MNFHDSTLDVPANAPTVLSRLLSTNKLIAGTRAVMLVAMFAAGAVAAVDLVLFLAH
ncbi:MAG: hypothetical protein V4731_16820 [Pseudomonadota bacterium]